MLKATLAATLGQPAYSVENWGTNITARIQSGTIRIWNNGQISIRLDADTRNPEPSPPPSKKPSRPRSPA